MIIQPIINTSGTNDYFDVAVSSYAKYNTIIEKPYDTDEWSQNLLTNMTCGIKPTGYN
jgi:hypothetical protein